MENRQKIVVVTNKDAISDLRKEEDIHLLYPLESFSVGYLETFKIEEIDDFVLINRLLTNEDLKHLAPLLKNSQIKGIVFEDLGLIDLIKDLKITKILMLSHISNNSLSINYYLDYVDSIILSTDLTFKEMEAILKEVKKPLTVFVFGNIPLMYSRRKLLTNYALHHHLEFSPERNATINDKKFKFRENDYGTVIYTSQNFYLKNYQKLPNILYEYYNPLDLSKKELLAVLKDKIAVETFSFLLDILTIYKIKEGEQND